MHFIFSEYRNFDFKIKRCKFVGFVKDVTHVGAWDAYFVLELRIKRKTYFISIVRF